jgi:alkanesulfonate monooxygenase
MKLRIFTEPQQGATYDELLTVARHAEALGFDAFFRSDHYLHMHGDGRPGSTDAWITLAGLARDTDHIRLGTLVTPVTFRLPGVLAISVAEVDAMSGGRVELGLGTGWFDAEHRAYGIPFPPMAERWQLLEEQLEIITGLWSTPEGTTFSFTGRHYELVDSPARPKPVQQPHPPIVCGGLGAKRTPALAAKFADELNTSFGDVATFTAQGEGAKAACERIGRDPATLRRSMALTICCGRDEKEATRRAERIGQPLDQLRTYQAAGTPQQVIDRLGAFRDAGASAAYLQFLDLADLDHLELLAKEVMPALA